jgi:hypothetical protein
MAFSCAPMQERNLPHSSINTAHIHFTRFLYLKQHTSGGFEVVLLYFIAV